MLSEFIPVPKRPRKQAQQNEHGSAPSLYASSPLYVGAGARSGPTQRRQSRLKDHVVNLISVFAWWSVAKNATALISVERVEVSTGA